MPTRWLQYILLVVLLPGPFTAPAAEQPCPRIISQSPYITHTLEWMGLSKCIVGASRYDRGDWVETGGILDPDAETIRMLAPDLAITTKWTDAALWRDLVPEPATTLVLNGFDSMAGISGNLHRIGEAAGLNDTEKRVTKFETEWREAAAAVHGNGVRALLLSPCGGQPWAYGEGSWLFDAFSEAGFEVISVAPRVHLLPVSEDRDHLAEIIEQQAPDVVFAFISETSSAACRAVVASRPVKLIALPGEHFLHPAPIIIEGLQQLHAQRARWQTKESPHE